MARSHLKEWNGSPCPTDQSGHVTETALPHNSHSQSTMQRALLGGPPSISWPQSNCKKNIKYKFRNILQNSWPVLLKTVKVIKNETKERLTNCHSQEEPEGTWWQCRVASPWMRPRGRIRTLGENTWNPNKFWSVINSNTPAQESWFWQMGCGNVRTWKAGEAGWVQGNLPPLQHFYKSKITQNWCLFFLMALTLSLAILDI